MKINVIGGSGFIGTRLCDRLSERATPFSIQDIRPSRQHNDKWIDCDVRDEDRLAECLDGDVVINLAAVHRDDVRPLRLYDDVNVMGASNICRAAERAGINKIIFTSSVAVYGFAEADTGESGQINPFNDYGRTKWEAEKEFRKWHAIDPDNRTLVIIRPTVVFGEGNRGNVYNLFRQINSGRFMMIGTGENIKSMAHVENVAAFIEHCLDMSGGPFLYNYVDKPDLTVRELVSLTRETLGKSGLTGYSLPFGAGLALGKLADWLSERTNAQFPVSAIRVQKFCATTQFATAASQSGFVAPVGITEAINRTLSYEFLEEHADRQEFLTE
jgi:nucleoside-diphosphate-sugar epimerase